MSPSLQSDRRVAAQLRPDQPLVLPAVDEICPMCEALQAERRRLTDASAGGTDRTAYLAWQQRAAAHQRQSPHSLTFLSVIQHACK